ncbi:MAG: outer membrane protein transport protein [Rikenellaceae bacterium]
MKKILLFALGASLSLNALAEGYQVNTLSVKQLGMGHTSVSQKLNAESVWFNPAAAAYQEQKFSLSAGVTGIMSTATATTKNDYTNPTTTYTTDNDMSTPLYVYANYKVNKNLALGLSFNTPFGSSMSWGDSWAGSTFVQDISLTAYTAQPTISYKMLGGKLSLGAGLMMSWGEYEQSKALANDVASVEMSGEAALALGYNIGIMYDINEKWSVGVSYRSKMTMEVSEGEAEVEYASDAVKEAVYESSSPYIGIVGAEALMSKGFSASLPLPATLSVGVSYYPTPKWTLSTEVQWVQWSAYESLDVDFSGIVMSYDKNYSDTFMIRLGGQYQINDWLTGRLGLYIDQSPVSSDYLNPETPSMTKVGYTCGVSFMPIKSCRGFSIDLAYAYITSADSERAGYCTDGTNFFEATYTATAHVAAVGASWAF